MRNELLIVAALGIVAVGCSKSEPVVQSPDGRITLALDRTDSSLSYRVDVDGRPLILPSRLGFVADGLVSAPDAGMSLAFAEADTVWHQSWGENKEIRDHYNEMAMTLADSALTMTLRVRAFDDGVAFRYEWEAAGRDSITVMDELTEFAFAEATTSWSIPADFDSYEKNYRVLPVDSVSDANTPFTFMTDSTRVFGSI
ncbi:MAG: glycoside hydrolase family 97 N-terminal domain-containing protein, partial [Muribaculum sp.]|nr:glycoside hydrolase family 97 N-terminal domain-containing protein [Muribaculum sp.]